MAMPFVYLYEGKEVTDRRELKRLLDGQNLPSAWCHGIYQQSNDIDAELVNQKPAIAACAYCTSLHASSECPSCGAPAKGIT